MYKNLVPIRNPVAKYLFANPALYPLANQAGVGGAGLIQNDYRGQVKAPTRNDQFDVKLDFAPTDKDRLSGYSTPRGVVREAIRSTVINDCKQAVRRLLRKSFQDQ